MNRNRFAGWILLVMSLTACAHPGQDRSWQETVEPVSSKTASAEMDFKDQEESSYIPPSEKTDVSEKQPESPDRSDSGKSIRLNIPQKIQETDYYCAAASLQMVLAYHGISMSQSDLARRMHTRPVSGTEYEDLAREASILIFGNIPSSDADPGYRAVLWKRNEGTQETRSRLEERIQTDLESGDPIFLSINTARAYGTSGDGVHQVVLYGADYDQNGNPVMYFYLDPSYTQQDPEHEGRKLCTPDELWEWMNDNPEPGYVW